VRHVLALDPGDAAVTAMDSGSRRSETFRALKAIMLRAAERQPVVVVVEDLHWIDPASEEYLAFLADAVPAARALLVCSYRSGYHHPFGDRTYHVRLSLRALSPPEMADITSSLLGAAEIPEALRALIAAKAEGNPFFVEEVVRMLIERGVIVAEGERWVATEDVAAIEIPETLHGLLLARIDQLPDSAKRSLRIAAVIGRQFPVRVLEQVVGGVDP
jgi:predicted ATPase